MNVVVRVGTVPGGETAETKVDFDGDGSIDANTYGVGTIEYTYTTPGFYMARIIVDDKHGGIYTQEIPVVVEQVGTLNTRLQAIVTDMLGRARAGDIESALASFTPGSRDAYRAMFTQIGGRMPALVDNFGTIVDGFITAGFAEYVLVRTSAQGSKAFFITLIVDADGVWRIAQM